MGVTIDDARAIAATLPRSYEALVRDQVRFRVGRIPYAAFYEDETIMASASPGTSGRCSWPRSPTSSSCPAPPTCGTSGSVTLASPRCSSALLGEGQVSANNLAKGTVSQGL